MNSFSFNRFGKMLRWVLSVNFKRILGFTIAGSLGWFLAEMIIIKMTGYNVPFHMVWNISQFGVNYLEKDEVTYTPDGPTTPPDTPKQPEEKKETE